MESTDPVPLPLPTERKQAGNRVSRASGKGQEKPWSEMRRRLCSSERIKDNHNQKRGKKNKKAKQNF